MKAPYDISVTVADPLVVACSAAQMGEAQGFVLPSGKSMLTYSFEQRMPIPAYLIALVAGDLKRAQIGPRSAVWCEEPILEAAKYELEPTEVFLKSGEKICGIPYLWGSYDVLVLPGAFPYGGMENPNITFMRFVMVVVVVIVACCHVITCCCYMWLHFAIFCSMWLHVISCDYLLLLHFVTRVVTCLYC